MIARDPTLCAILDRLTSRALAGGTELPDRVWERALLGPARELLSRPGKGFRGRLVEIAWALAGGKNGTVPEELPVIIELIHAGSLIVDDIQDGSKKRRGGPALHQLYPSEVALNTGNWLYFWPLTLLSGDALGLSASATLELYQRAALALARCHQGQALDLTVEVTELKASEVLAVVETIARLKSGSLMGLAAVAGAIAANASQTTIENIEALGERLGVALQMLDDLGSVTSHRRRDKGLEDLRLRRATWPWGWLAETASAPQFNALRDRAAASPDSVLGDLAAQIGTVGQARVSAHVQQVLALTGDAPAAARDALFTEIARLRASYD